jgi:hypothetical protein
MRWLTVLALLAALPALGCCHKCGSTPSASFLAPAPAAGCCPPGGVGTIPPPPPAQAYFPTTRPGF